MRRGHAGWLGRGQLSLGRGQLSLGRGLFGLEMPCAECVPLRCLELGSCAGTLCTRRWVRGKEHLAWPSCLAWQLGMQDVVAGRVASSAWACE